MFTRPHCRDWMPLLTQQLRLRNVIKIIGKNIEFNKNESKNQCKIYYTLHHSLNDDPIYISELVTVLGNGNADWPEIDCDLINKRPYRSICIKVWQKINKINNLSSNTVDKTNELIEKQHDQILFTWGINFSGLVLISKQSGIKYKPNTLIFQIHDSYFTSSNRIIFTIANTKDNININNTSKLLKEHVDYNSTSNFLGNKNSFKNESKCNSNDSILNKNCDIRNSNENINSILSSNLSSSFGTYNLQSTITLANKRGHSLSTENIGVSNEKSNNLQLDIDETLKILKTRYYSYNVHTNEIHTSYGLDKLLEIQKKQRKSKHHLKDINEISEYICLRSVQCINMNLISNIKPGAIYHNYNKSKNEQTMGKTLNRLLFQEAEIKPENILKAQGLKKQIENAKLRLRILKEEKERLTNNCKHLEKKLNDISDNNVETGSWLMSRYHALNKEKEHLQMENIEIIDKKENLMKIQAMLRQVKAQFCGELKEIFQIEKKTSNKYTICKIYLPNADELSESGHSQDSVFVVVPISLSSALGYVAHVVQMCSIVLNISLRNPIKCEGSRSKIFDNRDIPNTSREFPLYTRTYPPPKPVLYAIFLLNQNIAQLNYQSNGIDQCDLRATLENLLNLLNGPSVMGNFLLQLPNFDENNENIYGSKSSVSTSATDLNLVPIPSGIAGKSIDAVDYIMNSPSSNILCNDQRISRSVGSYSDDNLSTTSNKALFNSEPNLTTHSIAIHLENVTKNEKF